MSSGATDTKSRILEATWKLMEAHPDREISMGDVAGAAGISRQAVYLHFASRTELIVATSNYVDEVKGLGERLKQFQAAETGIELLDTCVEVWGNYIPEIYGLAKALMRTRETDEAAAAAWNNNMGCLRDVCREIIATLDREGILNPQWSKKEAIEMLMTLMSIYNWEQLTVESGWSGKQYIDSMKKLLRRTLIQ